MSNGIKRNILIELIKYLIFLLIDFGLPHHTYGKVGVGGRSSEYFLKATSPGEVSRLYVNMDDTFHVYCGFLLCIVLLGIIDRILMILKAMLLVVRMIHCIHSVLSDYIGLIGVQYYTVNESYHLLYSV